MWREKAIRWNWAVVVLNALVSVMQGVFAYNHWLKHEHWLMAVSVFFFCFNGYMAYWMWTKVRALKQDLKDYMWRTLSTPSEVLR